MFGSLFNALVMVALCFASHIIELNCKKFMFQMNIFHSIKSFRSFQCTEWHAKSAVCETTVYTRVVGHSELNWECILNSNSSPECMSELVLLFRWLCIVSPGSEVSWEQLRLWKPRAGRSAACCELSSSVSVCVWLNQTACVSACFLHLQYQPCWSNIWEQSCQFQQREKQR